MLFFNYEKIYILSKGNPDLILQCIQSIEYEPHVTKVLLGNSFIINEKPLYNNRLSARDRAEYLGILSFRNYADYLFTKDPHMNIQNVPLWVPAQVVKTNPLIKQLNDKLIFEEEI